MLIEEFISNSTDKEKLDMVEKIIMYSLNTEKEEYDETIEEYTENVTSIIANIIEDKYLEELIEKTTELINSKKTKEYDKSELVDLTTFIIYCIRNNKLKIEKLDENKKIFSQENIKNILSSINNYKIKKELIQKYLSDSPINITKLVFLEKSDDNKIDLLQTYEQILPEEFLIECIASIQNDNKKIKIIYEYKEKIEKINILYLIKSINNYKKREEELENNNELLNLIDKTNRIKFLAQTIILGDKTEEKLNLLDKYIELLDAENINWIVRNIIQSKNKNTKVKIIEKYIKYLSKSDKIGEVIDTIEEKEIEKIINNNKEINSIGLSIMITKIQDDKIRKDLIIKNIDKFDNYTIEIGKMIEALQEETLINLYHILSKQMKTQLIADILINIKDEDKRIEYLYRIIDRLDSNRLSKVLASINDIEKKTKIIDENINKLTTKNISEIIKDIIFDNEKIKEKYIDKLKSEDILNLIKPVDSIDSINIEEVIEKLYKIKKYKNKINNTDILNLIILSENKEIQQEMIKFLKEIYKDKQDTYKMLKNLQSLYESNSLALRHVAEDIIVNFGKIKSSNISKTIEESIYRIENIFLRNNLPTIGKIYKVFDIMHPDLTNFDVKNYDNIETGNYMSPNLKKYEKKPKIQQAMLYCDLLKCALESNNRSIKEYISLIKDGNKILKRIINGEKYKSLSEEEQKITKIYLEYLNTLHNNTPYGKKHPRKIKENIELEILLLTKHFIVKDRIEKIDKLPDKIISTFTRSIGINTIKELEEYMKNAIEKAEQRNIEISKKGKVVIKKNDYVKGIVNQDKKDQFYSFLTPILQNGSLCKEFLGASATSDSTPLDTDVTRIFQEPKSFEEVFTNENFASTRYGPIWIVLTDDDRFNYSQETKKYERNKLEIFKTEKDSAGHYGIRTGFPSSAINYFVVDEKKVKVDRIEYEIVMNGFYIPIVNTKGKVIFKKEKYDQLKEKMNGLKYYGTEDKYVFAKDLDTFEMENIPDTKEQIEKEKKDLIEQFKNIGIEIQPKRNKTYKQGTIELIDIGSTGRETNQDEFYSYDLIMQIDSEIYYNPEKQQKLYEKIEQLLNTTINNNQIRNCTLNLNNHERKLDITILPKTDKIEYTTEECLKDRLNSIKKIDKDKYEKVIQNIILAKQVLKDVYNSRRSKENPQGGLGGVGIENWILQNGGSFKRAAEDFLEVANNSKNFKEFKTKYKIWDFGENYMYYKRKDEYVHDEFIDNNMNEQGYEKMKEVLTEYLKELKTNKSKKLHL